jgi:hypothetical protein
MNNITLTIIFRTLQCIPLLLIIIPIFISYWDKRNTLNGLRKTRLVLLALFTSILIENLYFIYYAVVAMINNQKNLVPDTLFLIIDKIIIFATYMLLYYLFSHARKHNDGQTEKNQQI